MKQVISTHNQTFKHLRQLASSAKYRRKTKQTLLEGVHLCESYLENFGMPEILVYTDLAAEDLEVQRIIEKCRENSVEVILLGEANFRAVSSVENGIGLAFVIDTPEPEPPKYLTKSAVLLEDIQDPGNLGAILRTVAAAGVEQVFTSSASTAVWSPKALRAGMGAHFATEIYENTDLEKLIDDSKIQILATSLDAKKSIYQQDLKGELAWIFGNEGSGVSEKLLSRNIQKVIIPQSQKVESLNVAASVAVCLFEQKRQSSD